MGTPIPLNELEANAESVANDRSRLVELRRALERGCDLLRDYRYILTCQDEDALLSHCGELLSNAREIHAWITGVMFPQSPQHGALVLSLFERRVDEHSTGIVVWRNQTFSNATAIVWRLMLAPLGLPVRLTSIERIRRVAAQISEQDIDAWQSRIRLEFGGLLGNVPVAQRAAAVTKHPGRPRIDGPDDAAIIQANWSGLDVKHINQQFPQYECREIRAIIKRDKTRRRRAGRGRTNPAHKIAVKR